MSVHSILEALRKREPWMTQAACQTHPPHLWFPTRGEPTRPAKTICNTCPVQTNCLHYGINEHHGIWGGLSEHERDTYRKTHPMTTHSDTNPTTHTASSATVRP